jgi:predicted MPP superfamily phosphohydrolase
MRIAWLSDIHLEWLDQSARKTFVEAIAEQRPAVVLLGGDICSKAAGDVLIKLASSHRQVQFVVLSGHTHDAAAVQIADNLRILVAGAEYGRPDFRIFELPDFFGPR